jgi:hypothetical protein
VGVDAGDYDDLNLLVRNNGQTADLLRNDSDSGSSILIRVVAAGGNRDAIGTRIRPTAGDRTQIRDIRAGSSHLTERPARALRTRRGFPRRPY